MMRKTLSYLLLAMLAAAVGAEHPFRLVLNHGEEAAFEHECLPNEVDLIYDTIHTTNSRHLKKHKSSSSGAHSCKHWCKDWKYGYCFVFFCQSSESDDLLVEVPLENCVSEFISVNNAINSVLPLVSSSCQKVLAGGRDVACYDLEWRG